MKIHPDRIKTLRSGSFSGNGVLYWMQRDKRVEDNWALIASQYIALKHKVPLYVCFQYVGEYKESNIRHYEFLFKGLHQTASDLQSKNINFIILKGLVGKVIPQLIESKKIGTLIVDYSPLKFYKKRLKIVQNKIQIPFFQVDTHNVIPVWTASDKKEFAAHTLRKKIHIKVQEFLTEFPKIVHHPYGDKTKNKFDLDKRIKNLKIDFSVKPVDWIKSGEHFATERLKSLSQSFNDYDEYRNDPTKNALSNLSPYFHYGQLSSQRAILEIKKFNLTKNVKEAFIEQVLIRKELADNFCEYENNYDYFEGFHPWAQKTLNEHRNDEREYLYPKEQFEEAKTHDPLWNAAQIQMMSTGKMHGYMRMYWAKKIMEWSSSPETAQQIAIELNDKYQLDGRDPNGYTGIAWSIGGIHDRAWFERPVYGKIRYMNYNGCKSKFDVAKYIKMYES